MFNFGKSRLPANWPPLHHKCNRSKCTFPNFPQPAAGTYKCRGCEKGTYSVSLAQAKQADAQNRKVFYIPDHSLPTNPPSQPQSWNPEFPPYIRVTGPKQMQASRTEVHAMSSKVVRGPKSRDQPRLADPPFRNPHSIYPHGAKTSKPKFHTSEHTLVSVVSDTNPRPLPGRYVPERAERKQVRPFRVVNI
ncbi:hypothetical protein J3R30DRAFT_3703692 [Lentinula aciculospora]|uniref:Uncharacterized protein n=1 Tax=Lentinula aciculospora TaxID=153920 RepID=A0A9W9DM71_9AGAR|nr:hypothetical protein J3R30DRAFT_3703692 [Lentinula aciculospora]